MEQEELEKMKRNDINIVMVYVTLKDRRFSMSIRSCMQRDRFKWFGHVERINNDSWAKKCREMVGEGQRTIRKQKTWVSVVRW